MSNIAVHTIAEHQQRWTGTEFLKNMWRDTCEGLSIIVDEDARSTVAHDVSIGLVADPEGGVRTQYRISVEASVATKFSLTRKPGSRTHEARESIEDRFNDIVAIDADDMAAMDAFLTTERQAVFLQLLLRLPSALITNSSVTAWAKGVDPDRAKTERTMDRLIEVAEAMRPSWVDVALDERSVLGDLFSKKLDHSAISDRFDALYLGSEVNWFGEVLQIGATDRAGQRVAVLIGSADGRTSSSGRVVALTALDPQQEIAVGDIVPVTGSLWNLDARKRLFQID